MTAVDPRGRWRSQYSRVADVLDQRVQALRDEPRQRELAAIRERVLRTRREQGLPDHIEDPIVLGQVAEVMRLRDHATRLVEDWPPLTPEQRDKLAVLLRPGLERTP
jgi:hypothetical protein